MANVEVFNTGLTEAQLAEAFSRALSDYTDAQIDAMLGGKQDTLTTAQLSAVNSGINSTKVAQYDEKVTLEAEDRAALVELVDGGAKNVLPNSAVSTSIFTHNADDTVTVTGEVGTSNRYCVIYEGLPPESDTGKWIFSGCPSGGSITTYRLFLQDVSSGTASTIVALTGVGDYQAVEVDLSGMTQIRCQIVVYANYTADNVIFSPMLCTKAAWGISKAFVPHRPNYNELIARIEALESGGTDEGNDTAVEDEGVR